jgi:hypothetical protein
MTLWQVTTPSSCAGILVSGATIVDTAPILGWARGKPIMWFAAYCRRRKWRIIQVTEAHSQPH